MKGILNFFVRVLTNEYKDMFTVRLGVALTLGRFGIVGGLASFLGFFIRGFLGVIIEDGVFLIDLALDSYREGEKLEEFKKEAKAAYENATAKIYDEDEKEKIRKQYLDIISKIGTVGNGPKS